MASPPAPGGIWRKQVRLDDLDALWESRPIGSYHGEPCLVLDDLGDRVHIVYLGMDERRAAQLGYWEVDRGVFEVVVPRQDISDLAEERHEFPVALLLSALPRALGAGDQGARRTWRTRRQPERGGSRAPGHGRKRVPGGDEQGHRRNQTRGCRRARPGHRGRRGGPGRTGNRRDAGLEWPGGCAPAGPRPTPAEWARAASRADARRPPSAGFQQPVTGGYQASAAQNGMGLPVGPGMPGVPRHAQRRPWPTAAG